MLRRTMEPLQELELMSLAKEVPHIEFSQLCDALGIPYVRGQKILATRLNDYDEAMRQLLIEWKMKQIDATQSRSILASKLRDIGLGALGDKLSRGGYQPDQCNQLDKQSASLQSSSDIRTKISESLTISECREKLKNLYLNGLCKIPMKPWDRNDYAEFKDMHTRVTMVKKDARGKDTRKKEILKGSVAEIFSTKVNDTLPARILISAPAGRGKTTAVAKIAYDWAHRVQESALEHLPLLFVLKFRNTGRKMSMGEAIKSQLLSDVDDLTPEDIESFIRENQRLCHIILDGLDEYGGIAANLQGLGSNIVEVMLWKSYRECRVLVTTRPHLESFFNQGNLPTVYTKMSIEGFSQESSREYIDKFFASSSDPSKAQGLKAYLDNEPLINELVITPLFCLMVCHLWEERLLGEDIRTQTELLDSVNVFMMHYCNARRSENKISEDKLCDIILKLGKVALYGLLDDAKKLVFTPHDFRKVPNILEVACELGVISKTIVSPTRLQRSHETSSPTIEFYHKIAQEHSAGKYLAAKSKERLRPWQKTSFLDRVLSKIETNIGDYENLIRFAAGTENNLCTMIMEALLANSFLDESERYRILLDCSSETSDAEGGVSSLIKRCVTAQRMVLKSPTVYTVIGMQNLPEQLKGQIREVKFEDSTPSTDAVSGLWSCMRTFSALRILTISDCSLGFPPTSPELPSVMELKVKRMTSQSYEGLLSSIPNLKKIDITVGNAQEGDLSQIQTSLCRHLPGQELTLIMLDEPHSLPSEESVSGMPKEKMRGLGLHINDEQQEATLLGVVCGPAETVDLVQGSTRVMSSILYSKQVSESLNSNRETINIGSLTMRDCKLTAVVASSMWSCLRSFPSLGKLTISHSSLSFPPSPPELTSITMLEAERMASQSYEGLLSSLPGLKGIDITMNDTGGDISQITAGLHRTGRQQLTSITIKAPEQLPLEKKNISRETMRGLSLLIREQTKNLQSLSVSGVKCTDEAYVDLIEHVQCSKILRILHFQFLGWGSLDYKRNTDEVPTVTLGDCQLSAEKAAMLWTCLKSFTSLIRLTISDSSLSFPPSPPELTSVKWLEAKRVTSQSYEGLLSSLTCLEVIDISIDDAEGDISQITAGLRRTGGQQLRRIDLQASDSLPPEKKNLSRETMKGLSLLIREHIKRLESLRVLGVKCTDEDFVELIESLKILPSLHFQFLGWGSLDHRKHTYWSSTVTLGDCQLSTEMAVMLWTCLRSFTSLIQLIISDSSLSFPPSPPELTSVTRLEAKRVTSQSYEGLLSSLPGLKVIHIRLDDAERDISQITAGLRRTGGQQLRHIDLRAQDSLPQEKKTVSRETMRGLGLLIREQTKNLKGLWLDEVKCTDEDDLVYIIECCRHVKTMEIVWLDECGTKRGGRLESHFKRLRPSGGTLTVGVYNDDASIFSERDKYRISHIY